MNNFSALTYIHFQSISTPFMSNWDKMPLPRKIIEENVITPEKIEEMPSPRSFKTHQSGLTLHPKLLETCKVNLI
jgi:hypothetical protein